MAVYFNAAPESAAVERTREKLLSQYADLDRMIANPLAKAALPTDAPQNHSYSPADQGAPISPAISRTLDKLERDMSKYYPPIDNKRIQQQ